MAKLFIAKNPKTGISAEYIFGETNDFRKFLTSLKKVFDHGNITDDDQKNLRGVLTEEEFQKLRGKQLIGYECTIRPYSNGEEIQNLPYIHLKFKNEDYQRIYDDLKQIKISKESENLPSPIDGKYTMEVIEIKEVN